VRLKSLDHVALWVVDRDAIADFAVAHLGMHVVEQTERFTLVGADARRGKLTLFEAEGPRDQGALVRIGFRVSDLEAAIATLPDGTGADIEVCEGLTLRLVEGQTDVDYDLDHVALRSGDPAAAAATWQKLGIGAPVSEGEVHRLPVADAYLELLPGEPVETERPLLNHLGALVEDAEAWRVRAEEAGAEIDDVVDAPNTYAVFVRGPDGVRLEYVEHKPSFSLE
jgi:catechol 2,3-dioxygenase-like lactoylglutathione lyase family enzyme